MSLDAAVAEGQGKSEPFFTNWKVFSKEDAAVVKPRIDAIVAPVIDEEEPRNGIVTYAFTQSETDDCIYFTELFADLETFQTHLTEAEGESVVELFKCLSGRVVGYVNAPLWHEGLQASMLADQAQPARTVAGHTLNPRPRNLVGGKYGRRILSERRKAVMIELRVEPSSKEEAAQLLSILKPLTAFEKHDMHLISSYIVQGPGWWRRDAPRADVNLKTRDIKIPKQCYTTEFSSPHTIEFRLINAMSLGLRAKFSSSWVAQVVEIFKAARASEFIITAEDSADEAFVDLLEFFEDRGLMPSDRRSLLGGFLLHPFYTKGWQGKGKQLEVKNKARQSISGKKSAFKATLGGALAKRFAPPMPPLPGSSPGKPQTPPTAKSNIQIRRHPVKNTPEAVILGAAISANEQEGYFNVPLIDYLRTVTRLGHRDKEVPIGTLFGILERMRAMARDVSYINTLCTMSDEKREEEANRDRVQSIFAKLSLMGRGEFQKAFPSKRLRIHGLEDLIRTIEKEYAKIVDRAKAAVRSGAAIEYLGLQELYKIGTIVTSQSQGGILASFKVVDCVFEPIRSLMGALRYSFKVKLETVVYLGAHFLAVPFVEIFGEWKNVKDISSLPYLPISGDAHKTARKRIEVLESIAARAHTYMEYPAGSFFPSLSGKTRSTGAASSSMMRAAPGQVIIDVETGLHLGYAPATRTGELGISMAQITKVYLDYMRKSNSTAKSQATFLDQMNAANEGFFTAYAAFPKGRDAQPWPCVVGFSMNTKSWGHVLVDQLQSVLPDPQPWEHLVLPAGTKEMIMSLAESKILHGNTETARYRYNDVIAGKGTGGLYLLYGPPGTGKTLCVEALARFFGKPLYSISFAELGASTAELEERLSVTLQLAARWGCLTLLDEGDALVEKRKQGQLLLNSMTGVLLRLLENFEGSLFINSNRVSSFDPAALSRVTLAVKFSPLSKDGMRQVWHHTIARVIQSDSTIQPSLTLPKALAKVSAEFDLESLSAFPGSGRSIGAVMKMAIALSVHRRCDLTQDVLQECIGNFLSFHNDLRQDGAPT
eukprot:g1464.t1